MAVGAAPPQARSELFALILAAAGCSWRVLDVVGRTLVPYVMLESEPGRPRPSGFPPSPGWLSALEGLGGTPLFAAARWGCLTAFAALFQDLRSRSVGSWETTLWFYEEAKPGLSLMHQVCSLVEVASLSQPADADLMWANSCKIGIVFIKAVGDDRLLTRVVEKQTAAMVAAQYGLLPVLQQLRLRWGDTQWASAMRSGCWEKELGARFQRTALTDACRAGNVKTVAYLLTTAPWSVLDLAAAVWTATLCSNVPVVASSILPAVLSELDRVLKVNPVTPDSNSRRLASPARDLLSRALSRILGWQPFHQALVSTLVCDLGVPPVTSGPMASLRSAISSGCVDGVQFVLGSLPGVAYGDAVAATWWPVSVTAVLDPVHGETPLMLAARCGSMEVLECVARCILHDSEQGSGSRDLVQVERVVCAEDKSHLTAAMHAANALRLRNLEVLETCFSGMIPTATYSVLATGGLDDGTMPLAMALEAGLHRVSLQLLSAGSDPAWTTRLPSLAPNDMPALGPLTCLDVAVMCGSPASLLEECLASMWKTAVDDVDSGTASGPVCTSGLASRRPDVTPPPHGRRRREPCPAQHPASSPAAVVVDGPDAEYFERFRWSTVARCLYTSCTLGAHTIASLLLGKLLAAPAGVVDWSACSPLHAAITSGSAACVRVLLDGGLKPTPEDVALARGTGLLVVTVAGLVDPSGPVPCGHVPCPTAPTVHGAYGYCGHDW